MNDLGDLLAGPAGGLGFGGMAGLVVGYTAKKLTKLVALALGVAFILVQALVYLGVIEVNWTVVQSAAEGAWQDTEGVTLADRAWDVLVANLPFGGDLLAGFAIGFKIG